MAIIEQQSRLPDHGLSRLQVFKRDEYYAIAKVGIFNNVRVELIEGCILDQHPRSPRHSAITDPIAMAFDATFSAGFAVRNQAPIALGDDDCPSDPQPDAAVVIGRWRDYYDLLPTASDVRLVVELPDSSQAEDRTIKATLYASFGIPDYWIVNLMDRTIEVHRNPVDGAYASITSHQPTESIEPLHVPGKSISLSDFLTHAGS